MSKFCPKCGNKIENEHLKFCTECGCAVTIKIDNQSLTDDMNNDVDKTNNTKTAWDFFLTVFKKYAVFTGRAQRSEYWYFILFNTITSMVFQIIYYVALFNGLTFLFFISVGILLIYTFITFLPALAVSVRRLHDVGKSGWMLLVMLIPIIGMIWLWVLMATDSEHGSNQYGPNPKLGNDKKKLKNKETREEVITTSSLMTQLILAGIGFTIWALYIILTYYSKSYSNIDHLETTTGYGGYIASIIIIYGIYKIYTIFFSRKVDLRFTFWHLAGIFMLHLFILCVIYTSLPSVLSSPLIGDVKLSSFTLFLHVISLLIYPISLVLIARSIGETVIRLIIKNWRDESLRLRVPAEISIGLFIFTICLLILGFLGIYSLAGLMVVLALLAVIGIPGIVETYRNINNTSITYKNHTSNSTLLEAINPKLLSAEFAFLALSFLIGISLINAIRPMPIGWDDLGVYMNYPKIMAMTGEYLKGAGLYTWQLITGTGFLFSYTAAQAFYVNQLGGILAVIIITSGLSLIFENSKKKYLLSLPIIFAAVFYAMPMNIFQQAKDMKLDPALLAMSISGFIVLFTGWKSSLSSKRNLLILGLSGIIIAFAFSIKITTLMLIVAGFGLIAYRTLSIWGFLGFFFLFLAIFTKAGFWAQLNVWMPTNNPTIINSSTLILLVLSTGSFLLSWKEYGKNGMKSWIISSLVFLLGIGIGLSPWIIKNTSEVQPWNSQNIETKKLVMDSVLLGSPGTKPRDFTKLYTKDEYDKRTRESQGNVITSSGQSQNEDMGRYFGYEKGVNNYLKLPANLTFQKNQAGEFTEITFIFLAFIPAILLFVRSRKGIYASGMGAILLFLFIYYFTKWGSNYLTSVFSLGGNLINTTFGDGNSLLIGYIFLIVINISFLLFSHYSIDKNYSENEKLKEIIIVLGIYGFLFLISAFGIVWYGILVYFLFFVLIGLASTSFTTYDEEDSKNEDTFSVKITLTAIFFIFILVYFIRSAFPHGWNNFKDASYNEFKYNILTQEESIFAYRQDYITPIATLNIKNINTLIEQSKKLASNEKLKTFLTSSQLQGISIKDYVAVLFSLSRGKDASIAKDAKSIGATLYKSILYPSKEDSNTGGIYRIGTFMTYLIDKNLQRYFDDSLVFAFETYFYDKDSELTIERMKKLGLKYLLVDLNAATIDKDPRHALTTRFEHLLHTMKAKNLTLVDTDNVCLQLALDEYKKGRLQDENSFIDIAGTNYESYRDNGSGGINMIYRGQKQQNCYNYILKRLYIDNAASEYPYLANLKSVIDSNGGITADGKVDQQKLMNTFAQYAGQSWFALFEINDTPTNTAPAPVVTTPTTASGTTSSGVTTGTGTAQ